MVKCSDILPAWKRFWSVLILVLLLGCLSFVLDSCKNKGKGKATIEQTEEERELASGTTFVNDLNDAAFAVIREKGYLIGKVDGESYVLYVETANKDNISGKYYLIDSTDNCSAPFQFKLQREQDGFKIVTRTINNNVNFSLTVGSNAISGTVTTLDEQQRDLHFAFKRYVAPKYTEQTSTLYLKPELSFTQISDVSYGKAKGYWTSYPMEDDERYGKMILTLLPKTAVSKEQNLLLDLYLPEGDSLTKHPLLVILHGGAFFFGDKGNRNMRVWCEHFAQSGYVVAAVNYRLGFKISKASIQQCGYQAVQDAHAALRYLVAHADEYNIDPNFVFLAGTSAGSITALGTAFMNDGNCPPFVAKNKLVKKCGRLHTGCNEYRNEVKIKALANMWGAVYDLHELDGKHIPVISFHGTADQIVPFHSGHPFSSIKGKMDERLFDEMYGSEAIHEYLDSLHVRNEFHPMENCGHAPYQEKNGTLNEHYYTIQSQMQRFFYPELKSKTKVKNDKNDPTLYCLEDESINHLSWQVTGGIILDSDEHLVRVLWFQDAKKHVLRASGFNSIGTPFKQEWQISKLCS